MKRTWGIGWVLLLVLLCSCAEKDRASPWVLIYRDTQDVETSLDLSRIRSTEKGILLYVSQSNRHAPQRYRYRSLLVRCGGHGVKTVDSMEISSAGEIRNDPQRDTVEIGASGLGRVLCDLICADGKPRASEDLKNKARSVERVLLRLGS